MNDMLDVVLTSRVRLARNLQDLPFPGNMAQAEIAELVQRVNKAINTNNSFLLLCMQELPEAERHLLVERHLVSPDLAGCAKGAALINKDESISILIGEEDHLRIQCLLPGLQLEQADSLCASIDDMLCKKMKFAFESELGYLTACPTNLGTGMRASVMLHLPALSLAGQTEGLLAAISKLGYAVRGLYGEGSGTHGHIFQVSNQMTLGVLEEDIISNLNTIALRIIERERSIRSSLYKTNKLEIEDIVYRSKGVLQYARKLNAKEAMQHISNLKLGAGLGLTSGLETQKLLNRLLTDVQCASIRKRSGLELSEAQCDEARANIVREALKGTI
ncbi:MAG TPA: protein arginine kinase [Clostridia bacterium]|nr:protein arginine kinase [Clostridia bacterium]